jgi:hypothetical protein
MIPVIRQTIDAIQTDIVTVKPGPGGGEIRHVKAFAEIGV